MLKRVRVTAMHTMTQGPFNSVCGVQEREHYYAEIRNHKLPLHNIFYIIYKENSMFTVFKYVIKEKSQ